jgi:hypothetical protein
LVDGDVYCPLPNTWEPPRGPISGSKAITAVDVIAVDVIAIKATIHRVLFMLLSMLKAISRLGAFV